MNRHHNGRYRIDYFQKLLPVSLMIWTAVAGLGFKTSSYIVQAREGANNAKLGGYSETTTPSPTPSAEPTTTIRVISVTILPTATPTPTPTQKQEIIDEIVRVFGEEAPNAFNVLHCENRGLRPDAINHNRNGSTDHSIFQINSIHIKRFGNKFVTDWKENIRVAHVLQQEQGWRIWSCSERVDITPFWKE